MITKLVLQVISMVFVLVLVMSMTNSIPIGILAMGIWAFLFAIVVK